MLVAMGYLLGVHLMRQFYDYGSYALDITGPLMIITQKVTSLAFSIHDGFVRKDEVRIVKPNFMKLLLIVRKKNPNSQLGLDKGTAISCDKKNAFCIGILFIRLALPKSYGWAVGILQGLH